MEKIATILGKGGTAFLSFPVNPHRGPGMDPHRTSLFSKGKEVPFWGKGRHHQTRWYDYTKKKVPPIEGDASVY